MAKNKITVSMKRSSIATKPSHRKNLKGLGVTRIGHVKVLEDTASIRGMIKKVIHLVNIQKGDQMPKKEKRVYFSVVPQKEKKTTHKKASINK